MKEKFKDRYVILAMCMVMVGIMMIYQLVNLQIVRGEEYDEKSQRRLLNERKVPAPRGNIVDRYGAPIAVNRMGFSVQIIDTKTKSPELNGMILKLIQIFEKNNDSYNKSFNKYLSSPTQFGRYLVKDDSRIERLKTIMGFRFKGVDAGASAADVFKYLKGQFKISDEYTDEEAYKIMTVRFEILGYSSINPMTIAKDVCKETVAQIEERNREFPGVTTDVMPVRKYVNGEIASHVIGYVAGISDKEYSEKKSDGYSMNDIIGKSGVEAAAEQSLRGKDGLKRVEVDTGGRLTEELDENPAEPGNDVVLTLDNRLQKVAMESIERNIKKIREGKDGKDNFGDAVAGSAVAIDVNSGEVLAMASYPSYDPSLYLAGADNKAAQEAISNLFKDKSAPALNRAINGLYAPGSTFKPLTAIAGLEEGAISSNETILDTGFVTYDGHKFYCMEFRKYHYSHGNIGLTNALATSCNVFFHELGVRTGIDKLDKWAKMFGLGEKTGIDVGKEYQGRRNNKETMKISEREQRIWGKADTAQASIGQLYNIFTPLQIANYVSTLANGGKKYKPYVIKRVVKYDGSVVAETKPEYEQIALKPETLKAVKAGMLAVTNATDGTAVNVFKDFPQGISVAGKTGTPETGREAFKQSSDGLFICYAPADNPKIAVAIVIEHGVWGSNAAPVARDILAEYFNINKNSSADDKVGVDQVMFTR
ncbi:MAG: penicillin-binding protein 2 [Clostridia bacterium]|nr:penicillin-binding protein 2 [Clostridia bacterium]